MTSGPQALPGPVAIGDSSGVEALATPVANAGRDARLSPLLSTLHARDGLTDRQIVMSALALGCSIVAGMAFSNSQLTTFGALASIAISLVAPAIGLATLAFMAPLQPPLVVPAPGFNAVLVGAIVLGCLYRLPIDRPRIRLTPPIGLLSGFVLYLAAWQVPDLVTGYAGDLSHSVGYLFLQLLTGFGAVLAAAYVLSRRSPFPYVALGLASAALAAILGLISFNNLGVGPPFAALMAQSDIDQRAVGSFYNPNYFAEFEAIAAVTATGLLMGAQSLRVRSVLLVVSVVTGAAVLVSMSRGGLIALAAGLACLAFARFRVRAAIVIASGLLVGALVLFPILIQWRLSTLYGSSSGDAYAALLQSDEGRLSAALVGPQLFLSSPLFGIGPRYAEAAGQITGTPVAAHNWYINVLAEDGVVGIAIWSLFLGALVVALRSRSGLPRSIGFGVLGAYTVGSIFLEPPPSFQTSALPILVLVAAVTSDWASRRSAGELQPARVLPAPHS